MENNTNYGVFLLGLLTIAFIVLKLTNFISWSWVWILSPTWIPIVIVLILLIVYKVITKRENN